MEVLIRQYAQMLFLTYTVPHIYMSTGLMAAANPKFRGISSFNKRRMLGR